ncbi:flagellar m-ring protein [Bacillus sp. OxB-1]|uniref:flagellar basal-body MS-ring/collar protein FliF n=1 Tax=Bacillus sp. (strain OxB-1) TaxID=98228 RepID=UPI0005821BFE|nr:flagellar basal-body MS-ring/collar protein FliF [Bacillus sp. OxB-1]BAQ10513.1 flagellar m-ring protein [Bacillus sp. OxB-1]
MNERLAKIRADIREFWSSRTKKQKITYIGSASAVILLAAFLTFFLSRTEFAPLYSDVPRTEIGRIKEALDSQGVPNKVAPGGTSILVPKERVDELLVTLAVEGIPSSGTPNYSFFTENASFGMTDNEFNMAKLSTMQNELANLIKGVEGVKDAKVMITLPNESVFLNDSVQQASASIVLNTDPGHQFTEPQVRALYTLVSKSLPNLSTDDIVIMNQYSEYYDLKDDTNSYGTSVTDQIAIKKTIERDLQRQLQSMLGTMMGHDKVLVSVTTDIDFHLENREENLVTPVDEESMEGIALSVQRITESFTGTGAGAGGTPEAEDPTDNRTGFVEGTFGNGDYERIEETVNNEVNRIRKEIVESPYKIRDIGIQVVVDSDPASMAPGLQGNIEQLLSTVVRTSLDKVAAGDLTEEAINDKIFVSAQPFEGKPDLTTDSQPINIPWWVYVIGAALLLVIGILVFAYFRKRRREREMEEELVFEEQQAAIEVDDINTEVETEGTLRRKQLEKMAKEKPEEFAKLLRTWIAEE